MHAKDELLGVLGFDSPQPRRWSVYEIQTFSEVADQVAVILSAACSGSERAQAESELLRREAILEAVSLSAADVSEQPAPPEPAPAQLDEHGFETILLVEDEDVVRALARRVLERCGYTVIACANGSEAIELAESDSRRIDLLLTDVVMPGLRGPEVAARVAASRPTIEVLYMSGYADEALLGAAALDERALIEKPFAVEALVRRVREALESRAGNDARMADTRV